MNIIEEFMKVYQKALADYAAGVINTEELYSQLMSIRSQARGMVRRVRSEHLKLLAGLISDAVDAKTAEISEKCMGVLSLQVMGCTYNPIDLKLLVNRIHLGTESVLRAHWCEELHDDQKPTRAIVVSQGNNYICTVLAKDFVLYVFPIVENEDGTLTTNKSFEQMATEYKMRAGMLDPRMNLGK